MRTERPVKSMSSEDLEEAILRQRAKKAVRQSRAPEVPICSNGYCRHPLSWHGKQGCIAAANGEFCRCDHYE